MTAEDKIKERVKELQKIYALAEAITPWEMLARKTFGYEKEAALAMCRTRSERFVVSFIYKDLI